MSRSQRSAASVHKTQLMSCIASVFAAKKNVDFYLSIGKLDFIVDAVCK